MKISPGIFLILLFMTILVYVAGMFPDIMQVDAVQYASISLEMLQRDSFLQIFHHGKDYLDKPPLLFWLNALSFKLFGFSNFAYRLPSVLVTLLGLWSTFRLASSLYDRETGLMATLILATTQAFFLFNNDIRTDTLLAGFVIFAVWQLHEYLESGKMVNLLAGSAGIGLAMLSKGPVGLMIPVLALLPGIILQRRYQFLVKWRILAGLLVIILILLPMIVGLYRQYGSRGLYFFFWLQSFGRLTGENKWHNDAGYFFLSHSFLWSFLPWSLLAVTALFARIRDFLRETFHRQWKTELVTLSGFLLPFLALSTSKYQLPHYIFVLYPFAAIASASFARKLLKEEGIGTRVFWVIHGIIALVMFITAGLISGWLFPGMTLILKIVLSLLFMVSAWVLVRKGFSWQKVFLPPVLAAIALNLVMNLHFYPQLLKYQAGSVAARWVADQKIPVDQVGYFRFRNMGFEVYLGEPTLPMYMETSEAAYQLKRFGSLWLYTDDKGLEMLQQTFSAGEIKVFDDFHPTTLTWKFLNPQTRESALKKSYLVHLIHRE
jgi:4-amino-4-deoxy-L-arabinose transferase-like glycosyltransferase